MATDETLPPEAKHTPRQVASAVWRMLRLGFALSPVALPVTAVLLALNSMLPFATSFLDSRVIDEIVRLLGLSPENRLLETLVPLIILVIGANVLERLLWILIGYAEQTSHYNLTRALTLRFLHKASELDMAHYESQTSSNLIQKAKDSYTWKPAAVINRTVYMSGDVIRILTSMAIILSFSLPAFLLALVTTIPALIARLKLGEGSWSIWEANATDRRRFWRSVDLLTNEGALMELRIFRTRLYLLDTIRDIYDRFTDKERKDALRRTLIESLVGNLSTIGTMAFWVIAIIATLNGQITIGLLTFYTGALDQFSSALTNLFRNLSDYYEDGLYLVDMFDYYDLPTTVKSGAQTVENNGKPPLITFRNVTFTYPNAVQPVLKNFNLVIEPGAHIALVGVNGAGKSTIIKLLCRFYDVTEGQILINGVDLRHLDSESWYQQIGVLFQDFIQYGQFSARTNIELGDMDGMGDADQLDRAIFKADAEAFLKAYSQGIETVLDKSFEGGVNPSVGQWQRIALARAFFRDAPVLVLDEPTSAIDALAEYEIFERIYNFSAEKTLIIISHRFSTVRNADTIYVVDDGQIIESGSHESLLRLNGQYAKAFEAQAQGYR
ncbi:MAG: ABC transporter ATP-binding protein [Anaerolineae bacterium]|nr:ABC transporter ATP-binding protein [Anaerolineae bacterium]